MVAAVRDNGRSIKWTSSKKETIAGLMRNGMTCGAIAHKFDVSESALRDLIRRTPGLAKIGFANRGRPKVDAPSIEAPEMEPSVERHVFSLPWVSIQHEGKPDPAGRKW